MPQALPPIGAEVPSSFGLRADGTPKGNGFLGVLNRPDGSVSSEISIGVNIDGKEVEIPTLVPTLTAAEKQWLLSNDIRDPKKIPPAIIQKAVDFATPRIKAGKSPFADDHESPNALPPIGGEVTPKTAPAKPAVPERSWVDTAEDVALGAAKGVGNTVYGLGKLVHDYTPIGRISDAIQPGAFEDKNKPPELTPTNTAQKVGQAAEQVGEFFLPTGMAGKAAKAVEAGKAGLLTMAQGGGPVAGGVSAGLAAAIPGAGAAKSAAGALEESAVKTMANSLRATKEWAKAESEKLAPEMLQRGIGGTFTGMRDLARSTAAKVGQNLEQAYQAATAAGQTVPGPIVQGNIQLAADALHITTPSGARIPIPGHETAIAKLNELADFVGQMGPDIPVDKAAALKRTWDQIVSKAGLFGQNKMAPASEKAEAFAYREASSAFRDLLNTNPDIAALNKEASFWIGLKNVLNATKLRKVGQTGVLFQAGATAAGATAGALSGDTAGERAQNAVLYGVAGRQLTKLLQSPLWMSKVSAPAKQALADALASNSAGQIISATQKILSSLPAQLSAE